MHSSINIELCILIYIEVFFENYGGKQMADNNNSMDLFGALSDKTRFNMVRELLDGEKPCSELIQKFSLSKSTFSHHAKILSRSGLVKFRREGKYLYFSLDKEILDTSLRSIIQQSEVEEAERKKLK